MKSLKQVVTTEHKVYQLDLTNVQDNITRGQMLYQILDEILYELRSAIPFSSVKQFILNTSSILGDMYISRWLGEYFENIGFVFGGGHFDPRVHSVFTFSNGLVTLESNLFQHKIFIYPEFNDSNRTVSMRPELLFEIKLVL